MVELPREDPEAALRLFAGIPGLRVLVVGGDGTVGCAWQGPLLPAWAAHVYPIIVQPHICTR